MFDYMVYKYNYDIQKAKNNDKWDFLRFKLINLVFLGTKLGTNLDNFYILR